MNIRLLFILCITAFGTTNTAGQCSCMEDFIMPLQNKNYWEYTDEYGQPALRVEAKCAGNAILWIKDYYNTRKNDTIYYYCRGDTISMDYLGKMYNQPKENLFNKAKGTNGYETFYFVTDTCTVVANGKKYSNVAKYKIFTNGNLDQYWFVAKGIGVIQTQMPDGEIVYSLKKYKKKRR